MNFSKDSYWLKSGFFSLLQNISNLVLGFGGFYLLVRLLKVEDFGVWTLFVTTTSILEVARVGFVKNGFIKFNAEVSSKFEKEKLLTASFFLNFLFAASVSIAAYSMGGFLANLWDTPQLKQMFHLYGITSLLLVPFFQFEFVKHSGLDFRSVFYIYFIRNGVLFLTILLGYFEVFEITLTYLVLSHLSGALLGSIAGYLLIRKTISFSPKLSWEWLKKLSNYGKYVVGTSISSMLYSGADQFMLGSMLSTSSVAVYAAASRVTNLINIPSMTLSAIAFPKSAQIFGAEGKNGIKTLYEKSVGTLLAIVFPVIAIIFIFSSLIIFVIAGESYYEATSILEVSIWFSLFLPFSYQFGTVFDSIGFPNFNFYYTSVSLMANIVLNYFLILEYGIIGAIYGTLFTIVIGFVFMQISLALKLGVNTLNVFKYMIRFYMDAFIFIKENALKLR